MRYAYLPPAPASRQASSPSSIEGGEVVFLKILYPVRNSSGALNPAGIILKCNPDAEQRGIISNGVKNFLMIDHKKLSGEIQDG